MEQLTVTAELQQILFSLFQTEIFNIDGKILPGKDAEDMPEEYIKKSELIDRSISLLNIFGEQINELRLMCPED